MKRFVALLLILLCLPMTRHQIIRRIRCQDPTLSYEELYRLETAQLRGMIRTKF